MEFIVHMVYMYIFFLSLKYIFVILPHMYIRYLYGKLHSHGFAFKVQTSEISFLSHMHVINRESYGKFIGYNCFLFLSLKYSQFSHLHVEYRWRALPRFGPVRRLCTQIMARSTDRHLEITEVLVILTNTCTRYLFGELRGLLLLKMAKSVDQYLERRFSSS